MTKPTTVEITEIAQGHDDRIRGHVDLPARSHRSRDHALEVSGWVIGTTSSAVAVKLRCAGVELRSIPIRVPRPDVAEAHPDLADAGSSGFWALVGTLILGPSFEIEVRAVLADGAEAMLATIRGCHAAPTPRFSPELQPLLLTSLGRTGSTRVMGLLAAHPAIVVYDRHPYEMRPAKYWWHVVQVLAEPANHAQSAHWENFSATRAWAGHHPYFTAPLTDDPALRDWFAREYVEDLLDVVLRSIDGLYTTIGRSRGLDPLRYFAEKHHADATPGLVAQLYPESREIILVRDFRDMLVSIMAFNAKRGELGFRRGEVESDVDHIPLLARDVDLLLRAWQSRSHRAHLLRYEDLVRCPVAAMEALLSYLDLDGSASTIQRMLDRSAENPELVAHRTSPTPSSSVGRWRSELDPALADAANAAFGEALAAFGYEI